MEQVRLAVAGAGLIGKRHLEDVIKRATMTWSEVLVNSSNIGMAKGVKAISLRT